MPQSHWPFAVEAPGIGASRGEVMGYAFDCREIGSLVIEAKFSCYSAHVLTGSPLGMSGWPLTRALGEDRLIG